MTDTVSSNHYPFTIEELIRNYGALCFSHMNHLYNPKIYIPKCVKIVIEYSCLQQHDYVLFINSLNEMKTSYPDWDNEFHRIFIE